MTSTRTGRSTVAASHDVSRRSPKLRAAQEPFVPPRMRRDIGLVPDELMPYYQDVYDHVLRV